MSSLSMNVYFDKMEVMEAIEVMGIMWSEPGGHMSAREAELIG